MNLKGIKANFLGDSITKGVGVSESCEIYHRRIEKKYGLKTVRNYGISGTRFAKQSTPTLDNPSFDMDFCSRFSEMENDADLVVVFGGTNDFGHGDAPIGEMTDRTPDTFFGACHYLMSGLKEKYPNAKIVFMTPLHRASELSLNRNGANLECYVNIIKIVAEYYALPVCDLWSLCDIQPRDLESKEKFCPDGLHPNGEGHKKITAVLEDFLLNL